MSFTAAFRKLSTTHKATTASKAIVHVVSAPSAASSPILQIVSAPSPARSPRVVVPSLPPPCAKSATVRFWGSDIATPRQPTMQRSTTEGPRPLHRNREVMKRRETDKYVAQVEKCIAVERVTLVRSAAIKRSGRKNRENITRA